MNKLNFIVKELNEIFSTDYNCASLSALSRTNLMKLLIDVMDFLEILEHKDVADESTILVILHVLESIKYIPDYDITPQEFRNGLLISSPKIIHPIITFLLENKDKVKCRYYISKYVKKIEVPLNILAENQMRILEEKYSRLIEHFWTSYSENKQEEKKFREVKELEEDLWQMKLETNNVQTAIKVQKEKLLSYKIDNTFITSVGNYLKELLRVKKLQEQIVFENEQFQEFNVYMESFSRRIKVHSLGDLIRSNDFNKSCLENERVLSKNIELDLELMLNIINDNEPNEYDIKHLELDLQNIQKNVHDLNLRKQNILGQGIRVENFSRQKQLLQDEIKNLQVQNDQNLLKINQFKDILSGNVLHGKELKRYVSELRNTSCEYKSFKKELDVIDREKKILERTLEILNSPNEREENNDILKECKLWNYDYLVGKYELIKNDFLSLELKHRNVKTSFIELKEKYLSAKDGFNNLTDNLADEIDEIIGKNDLYGNELKLEERLLKSTGEEKVYYSEALIRLSQETIDSDDRLVLLDDLKDKLEKSQERKRGLTEKVFSRKKERTGEIEETQQINNCMEMVFVKLHFNK